MKVILVNGSPHAKGCTYTALNEVAKVLQKNGIETEIMHLAQSRYRDALPAANVLRQENALSMTALMNSWTKYPARTGLFLARLFTMPLHQVSWFHSFTGRFTGKATFLRARWELRL